MKNILGLSISLLVITHAYAATPGTVQWQFSTQGSVLYAPVVAADGTVYAPSSDQSLWAINSDGTKKWAASTQYPITGSPAVANDGSIFLSTNSDVQNLLYKFAPSGAVMWQNSPPSVSQAIKGCQDSTQPGNFPFALASAPVLSNNLVFLTTWSKCVYATPSAGNTVTVAEGIYSVNQTDGDIAYQGLGIPTENIDPDDVKTIPNSWIRAPYVDLATNTAITTTNMIDGNSNLSSPGLLVTNYTAGSVVNSLIPAFDPSKLTSPVGGRYGVLYIGDTMGHLFKYDESGNLLQTIRLNGDLSQAAPVVAPNGFIFVSSGNGELYYVDTDGYLQWGVNLDMVGLNQSVVLSKSGTIYVTASSGKVYALNLQGQLIWQQPANVQALTKPAVSPDGKTVYVGTARGIVAINA